MRMLVTHNHLDSDDLRTSTTTRSAMPWSDQRYDVDFTAQQVAKQSNEIGIPD